MKGSRMNRSLSLLIKQWLSLLWQMGVAGCVFALMLVITEGNPSGIVVAIVFCLTVVLVASLEAEAVRQSRPKPTAPPGASLHKTSEFPDNSDEFAQGISDNEATATPEPKSRLSAPPKTRSYRGNFYIVNFFRANLRRANFYKANLGGAFLRGTYLREAHFVEAKLSGADLKGADLKGVNLQTALLVGANLEGADLQGTIVINTTFGSNTGLSKSDKGNLRARGAIFEDPTDSELPITRPRRNGNK